jgi:Pyridoxamine 5'-phosphate oxidase
MTPDERDAFLSTERTCRVASTGPSAPHVSPLWFAWDGRALWLYSLTRSQRWRNIERNPQVSVVVDAGIAYGELRGVQITGAAIAVGESPRTGEPHADLVDVEGIYAQRYMDSGVMTHDHRHAWLRILPDKIVSWDFRKRLHT